MCGFTPKIVEIEFLTCTCVLLSSIMMMCKLVFCSVVVIDVSELLPEKPVIFLIKSSCVSFSDVPLLDRKYDKILRINAMS